jgi:hypothetical protein
VVWTGFTWLTVETSGELLAATRDILFSTASRPALEPTQSIQWVPRMHSPGVKRQRLEADHSVPYSAEVKTGGVIPPLQICLQGVVHN